MSTPSTATATTIHPHQAHYAHSHYQAYQPNSAHNTQDSTLNGTVRLAQPYNTYQNLAANSSRNHTSTSSKQPPTSNSKPSPQSNSKMSRGKGKRQPDWNEFYRNGIPREIIVIDDSPSPTIQNSSQMGNQSSQPQAAMNAQHTSKKRRTEGGQDATSYDNITPQYINSGSNTASLDRTTSIQTTAPTSLGSNGSTGTSGYNDTQNTGQKRKRITRQATIVDKKKKEAEDALNSYIPPKQPPIKATDVTVRLIKEVSHFILISMFC